MVKHIIHHHKIPPDTLEQWPAGLSSSNKRQLRQAARDNLFDCQSFLTLATIVRCINTEPYKVVVPSSSGIFVRLVIPRSSILRFRNIDDHLFLDRIAHYICGGEETRHIWHLIRKKHSKRRRLVAAAVQSLNPFCNCSHFAKSN